MSLHYGVIRAFSQSARTNQSQNSVARAVFAIFHKESALMSLLFYNCLSAVSIVRRQGSVIALLYKCSDSSHPYWHLFFLGHCLLLFTFTLSVKQFFMKLFSQVRANDTYVFFRSV